jgi:Icc-related predicted phosphoesterase
VKILAVSDVVLDRLYSVKIQDNFSSVDLLLGCGDLPFEYLEFLVTALNVPLLYVPGNHDPAYVHANPASRADGCEFLDRRVVRVKGLNIAGMGGSISYRPSQPNQYSQPEMYLRALSFSPALLWHRWRHGHVLDIMIAHSPPRGIHDDDDRAHIGFSAFVNLIRFFKPRYFLHGHTMVYKSNLVPPVTRVGETTVINVYPYRLIEVEADGR